MFVCVFYKEESVKKANIREKKLQKSSNCDALVLSSITVVLMLDMMMKLRPWGCCRCASSRTTIIESSHQVVLRRVVYVASSSTFTSSSAATNNNWMSDSRTKTIETTMMMRKSRTRNGGRVKMFSTSGSSLSSLSASSADEKNDKYYKQMILLQKQPQQSRRNTKLDVRAFASGSKGGDGDKKKNKATKKKKVTKQQREGEEEEEEGDIAWEEEGDEEEEVEAEDINVVYADYDEKDVQGGNIDTASTPWGELALECVKVVLSEEKNIEEFEGNLQLFAFKAIPSTKRIMISVDDLDDQYGSPNLDDLIAVSRKLNELAESKGFPDDVAIEVASPGAERKLTIPEDLLRFRELKMKVIYNDDENDNPENETMILNVEDFEEESGLVVFRLADVQENRPPKKGMPMSKKKKEWRKKVKYVDIASANLYIDTAI